jgi:curli biogenesis system outer membrane secretion channel CsgG
MKKLLPFLAIVLVLGATTSIWGQKQKSNLKTTDKVSLSCSELSKNDKPILAVTNFKAKAVCAGPEVGPGLSTMLMNALLESGCFRIVDREKILEKITEQGLDLSAPPTETTLSLVSKLSGAQVLVTGTLTEFSELESEENLGDLVGSSNSFEVEKRIDSVTARIAMTIRLINPETGNLILFKSFERQEKAVGTTSGSLFDLSVSELFFKSKAMEQAVQEIIMDAVSFISRQRVALLTTAKEKIVQAPPQAKLPTSDKCVAFQKGFKPIVIAVIPKEHLISNKSSLSDGQLPDPGGVNTILNKFVKFGYKTIDPYALENLRNNPDTDAAFSDAKQAASVGSTYGADFVITGEAFTSIAKTQNKRISSHTRLDIKVVESATGRILLTDSYHGAGLDNSVVRASQAALQDASSLAADDLIKRLCSMEIKRNARKKEATIAAKKEAAPVTQPKPATIKPENKPTQPPAEIVSKEVKPAAPPPAMASNMQAKTPQPQKLAAAPPPQVSEKPVQSNPAKQPDIQPVKQSVNTQPNATGQPIAAVTTTAAKPVPVQLLEIDVVNVNFTQKMQIQRYLEQFPGIKNVNGAYTYKNAHFVIQHFTTQQDIAKALSDGKTGLVLEKTGEGEKGETMNKQITFAAAK